MISSTLFFRSSSSCRERKRRWRIRLDNRLLSEEIRCRDSMYSPVLLSLSRLISHSPWIAVIGLFNSCEAWLTKDFSALKALSKRSSILFNVCIISSSSSLFPVVFSRRFRLLARILFNSFSMCCSGTKIRPEYIFPMKKIRMELAKTRKMESNNRCSLISVP